MAQFVVDFGSLGTPPAPDGRLEAPAFQRNHEPIWAAISGFLQTARGDLLEIGSGTGQHAAAFAARVPQLTWWPSDMMAAHLASIEGWRRHAGYNNLRTPQRIDLTDPAWNWSGDEGLGHPVTAILCINVLHICPWTASKNLIAGAGRLLRPGGRLFIYGPFKRAGEHTAPSDAAFDATLRAENPDWGVRDVNDLSVLARAAGLSRPEISAMPANNLVLTFTRVGRQN